MDTRTSNAPSNEHERIMTDDRGSTSTHAALELAQEFIRAVEAKDFDAVAQTLAPNARQLFMHSGRTRTAEGIANIVSGRNGGFCIADVRGKTEIMDYYSALFRKFNPLMWRDHEWSVSETGTVFFSGNGDMVVTRNQKPYRNNYVTRFDVENGQIVNMAEYANALMYSRLGVRPNRAEFRALLRAIGRMVNPWQSSTSGN
jgi:ketosteroid isomerase-like protein